MKYTINIEIPGGSIELEADSQKQVFEELSFWQSLPKTCPVDGSPIRLNVRDAKTGKGVKVTYYELISTGNPVFSGDVGQNIEGGTLFYDGTWTYYDGQSETKIIHKGKPVVDVAKFLAGFAHKQPTQPVKTAAQTATQSQPTTTTTTTEESTGGVLVNPGKMALEQQIKTLFPDNVLEATMWLLKRWTVKNTPGNVRVKIGYLTDDECSAIADQCAQYAEGITKAFKDFVIAGNASKQPTGK